MQILSPTLFIEINNFEYIFLVGERNEKNNFNIIYKSIIPIEGIKNFEITNFDLAFNSIKKNIYLLEEKVNLIFKDIILVLDNFHISFINLTGFKKLNGSQILKDDITYILNSLKSNVGEIENKKTILHIFNSKYCLDKKNIENIPIGLFGDFYSQELSFCLIKNNDFKNLEKIFDKCNLKIKKILLKSFVEGSFLSSTNSNIDTFFKIKINSNNSQILYFENNSLKFEQNFNFGSDIVIKDISKITSLRIDTVKKIINDNKLVKEIEKDILIEKKFFEEKHIKNIKKKFIFEIAVARIQELADILIFKNINLVSFLNKEKILYLTMSDKKNFRCFEESYRLLFSKNQSHKVKFKENIETESFYDNVHKLVHFGWKKEAVPVIQTEKSLIERFFDSLFT